MSHGTMLCVETSCDDTSVAVVRDGHVLSSIVSSQHELHAEFGGIVPEVASRRHTELLGDVTATAMRKAGTGWSRIDAVAVTVGPGLIGALLVGLAAAKTYAWRRRLPLIPVNHIEGHIAANYARSLPGEDGPLDLQPIEPPFVCLVASGGHTLLAAVDEGVRFRLGGRTLDDAAGEAFDKGARLLGLPYPGGLDFSFSGLKTALLYYIREQEAGLVEQHRADIAASYQSAIVRQLVEKTMRCAEAEGVRRVAIAGGVAANSALRVALVRESERRGLQAVVPPLALCTDNAAMVGLAADHLPEKTWPSYLDIDADAAHGLLKGPASGKENLTAGKLDDEGATLEQDDETGSVGGP